MTCRPAELQFLLERLEGERIRRRDCLVAEGLAEVLPERNRPLAEDFHTHQGPLLDGYHRHACSRRFEELEERSH